MSTIMPDSTITTTLPAPTWATSCDETNGIIKWAHKVELATMEVDGADSMTVEAYLFDDIEASVEGGVYVDRGTPEIQITRHDAADPDWVGSSLRFEIANARKFAATIVAACDAVEGTKAATA